MVLLSKNSNTHYRSVPDKSLCKTSFLRFHVDPPVMDFDNDSAEMGVAADGDWVDLDLGTIVTVRFTNS